MKEIILSTLDLVSYLIIRTIIIIGILSLIFNLVSCTPKYVPNISHPSKREIKKAMKYSTSIYVQPTIKYSVHNGY
jgi:hypothetical protein